jgi:hypothetical protein
VLIRSCGCSLDETLEELNATLGIGTVEIRAALSPAAYEVDRR